MAYQIVWTTNARIDFKKIVDYLISEWSMEIAKKFVAECESKIDLIAHFPNIGIKSEKIIGVHRILITKQNALYYLVEKNKITLLNFFDLRQNPDKDLLK